MPIIRTLAGLAIAAATFAGTTGALTVATTTEARADICYRLWYRRNAIYARNGYCFRTARAIAVFGLRCYPPYGRLNRWEQRRVSRIIRRERRLGCR